MARLTAKVPPFEYVGGKELVDKLKEIYDVHTDQQLADWTGVPAPTIGTWKKRNLTPWELIIRTCIAKSVNLEYLALGKGEVFQNDSDKSLNEVLTAKRLEGGKIVDLVALSIDKSLLSGNLDRSNCMVVVENASTYFVKTSDTNPTSGRYLIDVDGSYSINQVQRLPGKKLAVDFNGSTLSVNEEDIKVVGRVEISMVRE
ncbi:helix-turn-helix domain-containing protein [Grimontia marina]|nr:helix-turn-helix domain-containing protein [Grimontia marina]